MNNTDIDISVIVPVYNVEEYLEQCLDSLLRQEDVQLEVIMIDDGSTDESGVIADEYVAKHPNFSCYHISNGGLGHARNTGVRYANGKYITFLDSDDIIVDNAYTRMFRLAEKHDAELTVCNVERFDSTKHSPSPLHNRVFLHYEEASHIKDNYDLINDTISCNKLIRRDFFENNHFVFPEKILYEDIPVTIPMHFLCNKVAMMKETGYLWRQRDGGSKSITQRASSMKNLIDRITIIEMLDAFFKENVHDKDLCIEKQVKYLEVDLMIFVNKCDSVPKEEAFEMIDRINTYIDESIEEEAFEKISVINKQKYAYVRKRDLSSLVELLNYDGYFLEPVYERNGRLLTELPEHLFAISDRDVTKEFNNISLRIYVEDITCSDEEFTLKAHLYRRRFSVAFGEQNVKAYLVNSSFRKELKTKSFVDSELTANTGRVISKTTKTETEYNYDGTGFLITINAKDIRRSECADGSYHIELKYENRLFSGREILKGIKENNKAKYNNSTAVYETTSVKLLFSQTDEVFLRVDNNCIFVDCVELKEDNLQVTLNGDKNRIVASELGSYENEEIAAERIGYGKYLFNYEDLKDDKEYCLIDKETGNVVLLGKKQGKDVLHGNRHVIIGENNNHAFLLTVPSTCSYIQDYSVDKKTITLRVKRFSREIKALQPVSARIVTENKYMEELPCISNTQSGNCEEGFVLSIDLNQDQITKDFYAGNRAVFVEYKCDDGIIIREPLYGSGKLSYKAKGKCLRTELYMDDKPSMRLSVRQVWPKRQSTINKRRNLIQKEYPKYRKKPLKKNRIVFESMWGRNYSCNPQAIYEYIDEHFPGYECIWALNDARIPIRGKGKRVRRGSLEYYYYLATAKYLVNNVNFPNEYEKREGQIEIQTMHGTPLKTIGLDVTGEFPTQQSIDEYISRNKRWDYLLVQGKFMEEKAYPIYRFQKTILQSGYPRTDKLVNADKSTITKLKKKLGLPLDKKILLYTPTWRVMNRFDMKLDLEEMKKRLSDEYVLLIRLHHLCAEGYEVPEDRQFIYDLTRYNYVEDLYLVSDILITDYSSVMFDYALLEKPMVFFTYDLDEYCDKLRGLYVDFREEAPGPICMTSEEVVDSIVHIYDSNEIVESRVNAFVEKYLSYEQGNSAEMVVQEVMKPKPLSQKMYMAGNYLREGVYLKTKDKAKDVLRSILKKK